MKKFAASGVIFLLLLLIYLIDFRGISTYFDTAAADVNNALFSGFYPSTYQDEVIVIVADDHTVNSRNLPIPLPFSFHQSVISRIALLQPRMLMVDYVFDQEHKGDPSGHVQLQQDLVDLNIPVFLGTNPNSRAPVNDLVVRPAAGLKPVSIARFTSFTDKNKYCRRFSAQSNDGSGNCLNAPGDSDHNNPGLVSAAWAMYLQDCASKAIPEAACTDDPSTLQDLPVRIIWGASPSSVNQLLQGNETCSAKWLSSVSGLFSNLEASGCPHHTTISVDELACIVRPLENSAIQWEDQPEEEIVTEARPEDGCGDHLTSGELANQLSNKVIIYAGFFGTNLDIVDPPTTGAIAGAHFHAMAYDNLLTYSGHAKADTTHIGPLKLSALYVNMAFFTLCWVCSISITNRLNHLGVGSAYEAPQAITGFISMATILVLSACYIIVSFFVLGLAPANWIGGILTSIILPDAVKKVFRDARSVLSFLTNTSGSLWRRTINSIRMKGE